MPKSYAVRTVVFRSGERFPVLIERETGIPLFGPAVFSLTRLRARNLASATIEQAARALMVLHVFLDKADVDLVGQRLAEGLLLTSGEIEELCRFCRKPLSSQSEVGCETTNQRTALHVHSLSSDIRRPTTLAEPMELSQGTAAIRLGYIRDYLDWLVTTKLLELPAKHPTREALQSSAAAVRKALQERLPGRIARNQVGRREGLSPEAKGCLQELIEGTGESSPWRSAHARQRNTLMIFWFLKLGIRRGELLGVRISDIDFQANEVLIRRRADDDKDPRRHQPNAKTLDRVLPLHSYLAKQTHEYILGLRRGQRGASRHDFLFVANGSGAPLTIPALNQAFGALRRAAPEHLSQLTPHVLRHTYNDEFTEIMDRERVPEATEQKMRSYVMGWSAHSGTAAIYTRRHVREAARRASLDLQARQLRGKDDRS